MRKLKKLLGNPRRYIPVARKMLLQTLCPLLHRTSFFLQGQMDIHPLSRWHVPEFSSATGGFSPPNDARPILDLEPHDNTRRDMLALLLRTVLTNKIDGAFAEVGVYKGRTARLIHKYAPERPLHLFDTFEGFTTRGAEAENRNTQHVVQATEFSDTSLEAVRAYIRPSNSVYFHPGFFPDSIPSELYAERFAFVQLDADLYEPILEGLKFFYPRMSKHGIILVHDYNAWPGARKAVDEFFAGKPELVIPMPDKSGSALIVRAAGSQAVR